MSIAATVAVDMSRIEMLVEADARDAADDDLDCHRALQESMDLRDQGHSGD